MNKQPKKLTLNKETLRDLTTHNAGQVKGGATIWCTLNLGCSVLGCMTRGCPSFNCATGACPTNNCTTNCATSGCHGKTYNKKCIG